MSQENNLDYVTESMQEASRRAIAQGFSMWSLGWYLALFGPVGFVIWQATL